MPGGRLSTVDDKISVKHTKNQLVSAVIELPETISGKDKRTFTNSESQNPDKLHTRDLVAAVGYAWNLANRPLTIPLTGKNPTLGGDCGERDGLVYYSADEGIFKASDSADTPCSSSYCSTNESSARNGQVNNENPEVMISSLKAIRENCVVSQYPYAGGPTKLISIYSWMNKIAFPKLSQLKREQFERQSGISYHTCGSLASSRCRFLFTEPIFALNGISSYGADIEKSSSNTLSCKTFEAASGSNVLPCPSIEEADCLFQGLRTDEDCQETNLGSVNNVSKGSAKSLYDNEKNDQTTPCKANFSEVESILPKEKHQYGIGKQEHAVAGAMSGVFVSLCLHPIDTIKTVIQSCRADVKPLHNILRTIISEKGVSGLYRGISSNILCSAPISAVYTFTYETVKKKALPLFHKEYCSLAHCTAGGCASIATSFIFTPSERIKQQMQVGYYYRNCWNALIQILKNGGLPSLYTGWGAVLCRNIPHSVIKFYTYEKLKQTILPTFQSDPRKNTVATLICGGVAGSTASLFTTPFDVVKTRLQTQIPGSITQYSGVFTTLAEIGKQEGLRGLYRGLTPRLVMYMIQGGLFFTSYESFKRLLSLESNQNQ